LIESNPGHRPVGHICSANLYDAVWRVDHPRRGRAAVPGLRPHACLEAERGMVGQIATRGVPAPLQVGRRGVIERTHAWGSLYSKLRSCIERRRLVVQFLAGRRRSRSWPAASQRLDPLPLGGSPTTTTIAARWR
jgi:hypothetical protein